MIIHPYRTRVFHIGLSVFLLAFGVIGRTPLVMAEDAVWPPPEGAPITEWGREISSDKPILPEYPRPQLVREKWLNLNGLWDYAITPKDGAQPATYDGKILVPFPIESVLSKVNKRIDENSQLWYHLKVQIPKAWSGQRILLHFGAVDWETKVMVNGKTVGTHRGGYDGFDFDITDALNPIGTQELTVSVWDPTEAGQPRGKQSRKPATIFYTPTTGIWQTVWMEPVPQSYIQVLKIVPNVDTGKVSLSVLMGDKASTGESVEAAILDSGKEVARAVGKPGEMMEIAIPKAKLWWPETPFLYDLRITLKQGAKAIDSVGSYFGMRKISVGPDESGATCMLLNNKFVFQNGFLDQGFWPDGIYTAPSDEALRSDIETTKKLGFNMLRKHIKVEPDRWYYWTDKLGILVWQDMPSSLEMSYGPHEGYLEDIEGQYEDELRQMVRGRFNHPSIVMWVTFNEGWGLTSEKQQFVDEDASIIKEREGRMVNAVRAEDPSRLIDAESGTGGGGKEGLLDFGLGDVIDYHAYGQQYPDPEKSRAAVIGEIGWGVAAESVVPNLLNIIVPKHISGSVLTQLTDVENESNNGYLKYDRTPKEDGNAEDVGIKIINSIQKAGYTNYPGRGEAP